MSFFFRFPNDDIVLYIKLHITLQEFIIQLHESFYLLYHNNI